MTGERSEAVKAGQYMAQEMLPAGSSTGRVKGRCR